MGQTPPAIVARRRAGALSPQGPCPPPSAAGLKQYLNPVAFAPSAWGALTPHLWYNSPMPDTPATIRPNPAIIPPILHEEPDFLIVDKPAGLVTQPGKGHASDSLLNGLFALQDGFVGKLLHNLGRRRDFGLLHRLDKDTSGLLVVAKTPNAYDQLRRDFEGRHVDKEYLALTAGIPAPPQGVIQARLKEVQIPNPEGHGTIKKVVISRQGQDASTAYRVLQNHTSPDGSLQAALVHLTIKTGRLHQIRAHMMFLNCQVLGDDLYAAASPAFKIRSFPPPPRLSLHASRLGFKHPATGKWVHYQSPLPLDLTAYAVKLQLPCVPQKSPPGNSP
jgi:23S rRNA pseudouridine1911/1915/1917 synthase